jgi:hypothetical protein
MKSYDAFLQAKLTPTLSRTEVNPTMAARGLRSAAALAEGKPCGTRLRYYAGCRCAACRKANSLYEADRAAAKARGEGNGLVGAERARAHLAWLSSVGVGRKTAADAAKVAASIVSKIIDGQRMKIRAQTERRILAVTQDAAADRAYIDGGPTTQRIDELLAAGYSRARIASEVLGRPTRMLQIGRDRVTARNAELVRRAYERLRLADAGTAARARQQLAELRDEHYRLDRIQHEVDELAAARGWTAPSISPEPQGGRWPGPTGLTHRTALLIEIVHARVFEEVEA